MTDQFNTLIVVLEKDMRDDEAELLMKAIQQLRGVISVKGNVSDLTSHAAEERAKFDLGQKLLEVIYPKANR
jgi:nitrate reductase NapAB chaperone NapD